MGFRNFIEKQYQGNPNPIHKILDFFTEVNAICSQRITCGELEKKVVSHYFSDCIVRRIYLNKKPSDYVLQSIEFEITLLAYFQMELIKKGVFVRGSINKGQLFARKDKFFGPAFNEAYDCENSMTVYPIISISSSLHKYLSEQKSLSRYFTLSQYNGDSGFDSYNHGLSYINYLFLLQTKSLYQKVEERDDFMMKHKDSIEKEINKNKDNPNVLMKYLWLKKYHNHYVKSMELTTIDKFIIG